VTSYPVGLNPTRRTAASGQASRPWGLLADRIRRSASPIIPAVRWRWGIRSGRRRLPSSSRPRTGDRHHPQTTLARHARV